MTGTPSLLTTGITPLPEAVAMEMQRPMVDGHGADAREMITHVRGELANLLETSAEVYVFPGTGSGGLEASLVNHLSPGDLVLACTHGFFSELYAEMAGKLGASVEVLSSPWGTGIDWKALSARLKRDTRGQIKAILLTHHETSTGVLNDLSQLAAAKGQHGALVLVNALSSMGGVPVLPEQWNVDVTVMCSHKGLMCAPGLTFLAVNERAKRVWETARMPRAYWDLTNLAKWQARGVTPFDPPLTLIYGMTKALSYLGDKDSRGEVYERVVQNADLFRLCLADLPVECVAGLECRAPNATVFRLNNGICCEELRERLNSELGIVISGGMGKFAHSTLRVNHQGWIFPRDMIAAGTAIALLVEAACASHVGEDFTASTQRSLGRKQGTRDGA